MPAAPWKQQLLSSLSKNKRLPNAKYIQLATVRLDGRPNVRTVVFRGFLNDTNDITMVTDRRSQKVGEVEHCPHGQICWYMPNTRQQFRLTGQLQLVGAAGSGAALTAARQLAWSKLSDPARAQFSWPHPGHPRTDMSDSALEVPAPDPEQPVDNFCLLVLRVQEVDLLELKCNRRTLFTLAPLAGHGQHRQEASGPAAPIHGAEAAGDVAGAVASQCGSTAAAGLQAWTVQELNP